MKLQHYLKLAVVIFFLFSSSACSEKTAKQQIQLQIENMQQAIEDKSLSDFMSYLSADFLGNNKLSKSDLKRLIFFHFQRNRNIETYKWQADSVLDNDVAQVEIYIVVTGSNESLPERGRIITINSVWNKIDDSWLIKRAEWQTKNNLF